MKNWREQYPFDRAFDWLLTLGRSGKFQPEELRKDSKSVQVDTVGGGDKPVVARPRSVSERPVTRQDAVEFGGRFGGRY